jgi:Tol biopolymer transport system component
MANGKILSEGTSFSLYTRNPDGSEIRKIFDDSWPLTNPSACGNQYIVFSSIRNHQTLNIWRINADGNDLTQLTHGARDENPYCSGDGKWLAYVAAQAGKPSSVWRVNIDGSNAQPMTEQDSYTPAISPDGKLLAYVFGEWHGPVFHTHIAVIPASGGTALHHFDAPGGLKCRLHFTADNQSIGFCVADDRGAFNIATQPLNGGPVKQVTNFATGQIFDFAWSPDGKQLAVSRGQTSRDVVLLTDVSH